MESKIDILNPVDGSVIRTLKAADSAEIEQMVERAVIAQRRWVRLAPERRSEILWNWGSLLERHSDEVALLDTQSTGKVLRDSRAEARRGARHARYWAGMADKLYGQELADVSDRLSYSRREPLGAYLVILPWNAPAHAFMARSSPPLACGNSVIVKPSELSPLSALRLAELALEAGFPEDVLQVVVGDGDAGAALCSHPDVRGVSFTGSPPTGRAVLHASASTFKKVTLELGGKSPIIVFPDADFDSAVRAAVQGITANAGQICAASSRLIVHHDLAQKFMDELRRRFERVVVGDPCDEQTHVGPVACRRQYERVLALIRGGVEDGASLVVGGGRPAHLAQEPGFFVAPTIVDTGGRRLAIAREEVFGPVLTVDRYSDEEEAVALANDTEFGLAAYVWTRDSARMLRVLHALEAGVVHGNSTLVMDSGLPFGGFKSSGLGGAFGADAIEGCTQTKRVTLRIGAGPLPQSWAAI